MPLNSRLVYNAQDTGTTVLTGVVAGTVTGGPTLLMSNVEKDTLSALVTVDAETNTITLTGLWQVSNNGSTWETVVPMNNAANVILATGTGGADAAVTRRFEAPKACYGSRYARFAVQNLVVDGQAADTYRIGYCYENAQVA